MDGFKTYMNVKIFMQKSAKRSNQSGRFSATLVNSKNKSMILGNEIHCIAVALRSLGIFLCIQSLVLKKGNSIVLFTHV
jgi:hypothetical protein